VNTKLILLILAAFFYTGSLLAQEKDSVKNLPILTVTSGTIVNKEIDKVFRKTFPDAINMKW
jgi:lipoprotein signal peptidase